MFPHLLARFTAALPSPLKYKLKRLKPSYTRIMRLADSAVRVETIAGSIEWEIDELTSQQFLLGTYELYMQKAFVEFIRPGSIVYDIGAHAGFHSLFCALLVGQTGQVIAFEPNPTNRRSIERQLRINPHLNVKVLPFALSDQCRTAFLDIRTGNSQGFINESGGIAIDVKTIDDLILNQTLPAPSLMKIDVEGHEEQVLEGALRTLSRYRPTILCDYNDGETLPDLQRVLGPLGYVLKPGPPVICEPPAVDNFDAAAIQETK